MKKFIYFLCFFAFSANLFAQAPSNDDCSNPIDLGLAPVCNTTLYNNIGATQSNIGADNIPFCFNPISIDRDVWFKFKTGTTILDFTIVLTGMIDGAIPAMKTPRFALYRGKCGLDKLAEVCGVTKIVSNSLVKMDIDGLTPNITYFIRVSDLPTGLTPNAGAFKLCVIEKEKPVTIDVVKTSTDCEGELYDSGGPNNPYKPNENYTLSICPTSKPKCITFALDYFNIDNVGDAITIYDSKTATGKIVGLISGAGSNGGGGVCYKVQATSGCMTINFKSDASVQQEGFKGSWVCSDEPCPKSDEIEFNTNVSDKEILSNLSTSASLVTLNKINCRKGAYGNFAVGDKSDLGLYKGIVLSSGFADSLINKGANTFSSGQLNTKGDNDLDTLSSITGNKIASNDACIVELDVFASSDEINFDYVFGSEEYPEFVNTQFNDIFAFLVSGPGIVGEPKIGNKKNIAILPNAKTPNVPVEINSVNNLKNWQYYRNNAFGKTVVFDGLTADSLGKRKTLTATTKVTPCQTYRLKLAVADRGDQSFDSGVFVSEIKGAAPEISLSSLSKLDYLTEGCSGNQNKIIFSLYKALDKDITYKVTLGGTATNGLDYTTNIPNTVTFLKGETSFSFNINPILDALKEGQETVTIKLSRDFGCGETELKTLVIKLQDKLEVLINDGKDTIQVCKSGQGIKLKATGGTEYLWTGEGVVAPNNTGAIITVKPTKDGWYSVVGASILNGVPVCTDADSIWVSLIDVAVSIKTLDKTTICPGDSVKVLAVPTPANASLNWGPAFEITSNNDKANQVLKPDFTTTYTVVASAAGCQKSATITITVGNVNRPFLIADSTICEGDALQLTLFNTFVGTTKYEWTPTTGLNNATNPDAIAKPKETTTYIVKSTSATCTVFDTVKITVNKGSLKILGDKKLRICKGTSLTLSAEVVGNGKPKWGTKFKSEITSIDSINNKITIKKIVSGFVTFKMNIGKCTFADSVFVTVDSLPLLPITAIKPDMPHCKGELITLISPNVYTPSYLDIKYQWTQYVGANTNINNLNLAITATNTLDYIRTTTNGVCKRNDTINIVVLDVTLGINIKDTSVCEGTKIQFIVDPKGQKLTDLKWDPSDDLSCKDCLNPKLTATKSSAYTLTATSAGRCPTSITAQVTVKKPIIIIGPKDPFFCKGGSVQLIVVDFPLINAFKWDVVPNPATPLSGTPTTSKANTYKASGILYGCPAFGEITVTEVNPQITIVPANPSICPNGGAVLLSAAGVDANTIKWTPILGLNNPNNPAPIASIAGTYTASGTFKGCPASASVTVTTVQVPPIVIAPNNPTICPGGRVALTASGMDNNNYIWTPTAAFETATGAKVFAKQTGVLTVTGTFGANKCVQNATVNVTSKNEDLIGNATATPSGVLVPGTTDVKLDVTSNVNNLNFVWKTIDENNIGSTQQVTLKNENIKVGQNIYKVIATDPNTNCTETATVLVTGFNATLPLAFNPNSTNKENQTFNIIGASSGLVIESFVVYNRWGNQVYSQKDDDAGKAGWNGQMHNDGDEQPSDTYLYLVKFKSSATSSDILTKKGDVTLLR